MALANVANWLRLQKLRVAVIDWDLEAPGIESFLVQNDSDRQRVRKTAGLLDLIAAYKLRYSDLPAEFFIQSQSTGTSSDAEPISEEDVAGRARLIDRVLPPIDRLVMDIVPDNQTSEARGGPLYLLTPGIRDGDKALSYAQDVQTFDWDSFYTNYDGSAFFSWLRQQLASAFDITLIDSRTGLTEVGGVCTREMADLVVCMCAPNNQNLEGSALFIRSLFNNRLKVARGGRRLRAALIPARYDNSETDLLLAFQKQFFDTTHSLRSLDTDANWSGLEPEAMWKLRVPYTPKYAYKEKLCVGAPDPNPDLLDKYNKLSRFLASSYLNDLDADERYRKAELSPDELLSLVADEKPQASLDTRLDQVFAKLSDAAKEATPRILLRLVNYTDFNDTQSAVLRRWPVRNLPPRDQEHIAELEKVGLLVLEQESRTQQAGPGAKSDQSITFIRFPFEDGLQEWRRLKNWLAQDQEFVRWRLVIARYAEDFAQSDGQRTAPEHYVKQSVAFRHRLDDELTSHEKALIEAPGVPLIEAQRRRLPIVPGLIAVSVIVLFAVVFMIQRGAFNTASPNTPPDKDLQPSIRPEELAKREYSKGALLKSKGDIKGALAAYTNAINLDPGFKDALLSRGILLLSEEPKESIESAIEDFRKAIELDPEDPSVYAYLSQAYQRKGEAGIAIEEISRAIERAKGEDPGLFIQRGRIYEELGEHEPALSDFDRSIDLSRKAGGSNPEAYFEKGRIYDDQGKLDEAVAQYDEAIAQNPGFWEAKYNRALAKLELGEKEVAVRELEQIANREDDLALREQATVELKKLGTPTTSPPSRDFIRVYLHYFDRSDADRIDHLMTILRPNGEKKFGKIFFAPPNRVRIKVGGCGDVRYYYPRDKKGAEWVVGQIRDELKTPTKLVSLSSDDFPKANPGMIEVWLPSLEKSAFDTSCIQRVVLNYNDERDAARILMLKKFLKAEGNKKFGAINIDRDRGVFSDDGVVKYFFQQDKELAEWVARQLEKELRRPIRRELSPPKKRHPVATPGIVDVWLSSLQQNKRSVTDKKK